MTPSDTVPGPGALAKARDRVSRHAHHTPVVRSRSLDRLLGARVHFKCENLQRTGAFKFRGACNAVFGADDAALARGVATHSSGNHAAALSLAARLRGVRATIVMPADAPAVKRRAVAAYGAEIVVCASTVQAREAALAHVLHAGGQHLVHPYDDGRVIAGQSTAGWELMEEIDDLEAVMAPVGGGGLLAGTALAMADSARRREGGRAVAVIGAEPERADDAFRSLAAGKLIAGGAADTVADGLRTGLGRLNFEVLHRHRVPVVTVSEPTILAAMRHVWERAKLVIEPSAAVPVAALLEHRDAIDAERIGIILSGGNVDLDAHQWQRA